MEKESKIYLAGHLGLVGSAILKVFKSKGYQNVIGKSISELNLMDTVAVNEFFSAEKPEYVILAAAKVGGILANNTFRGQFIYENLMIQNNVIDCAYRHKVKKLLFLGSTCIYPRDADQPMSEDALLTGPLEYSNEPYAIAKIAGIKLCESYNIQYGTNFISVMPTNLYGPNDNFDLKNSHVLPALLRKIYLGKCLEEGNWEDIEKDIEKRPLGGLNTTKKEDSKESVILLLKKYGISLHDDNSGKQVVRVEIWGTGKPMREFLWSEEMAEACVFLMENIDFKDLISQSCEIKNTHINIGTGKEVSIERLAFCIKESIGFKGVIVFNHSKPDGTMRKLTNPTKLHSLGWHHKIELVEGIQKLYDWYLKSE